MEMLKNYKVGKKAEMMKKIKRYQKLFDLFKKDLKYKNSKNTFDKSNMGLFDLIFVDLIGQAIQVMDKNSNLKAKAFQVFKQAPKYEVRSRLLNGKCQFSTISES